jgi:hypothetical protein
VACREWSSYCPTVLTCRELIKQQRAILEDRHGLALSGDTPFPTILDTFARSGVVILRHALPPKELRPCRRAFEHFVKGLGRKNGVSQFDDEGASPEWSAGERETGSWHRPWAVRHGSEVPAASVISLLLRSWAWKVVERICGSTDLVLLLSFCVARHAIDCDLPIGAHQDCRVVSPDIPLSIWIPLHDVTPGKTSGLGFVIPAPDRMLPAMPNGDVGQDYVAERLSGVWVPTYRAGDLSLHTKFSPHFTTGYATRSHRYSLEIRAMARANAPDHLQDPAICVGRRPDGAPVVVQTNCSHQSRSQVFVAQTALLVAKGIATHFD